MSQDDSKIVIDEKAGLIFENEEALYQHFEKSIVHLEDEFTQLRSDSDFTDEELEHLESFLDPTLDDPDEVWEDAMTFSGQPVYLFIRTFSEADRDIHYIAICYLADDVPTFIYLHVATRFRTMLGKYRRGEQIYSRSFRNTEGCAIEGDSLGEGDELAVGLCEAMLTIRGAQDIPVEKFVEYAQYREESIEEADEIWRNTDLHGNTLVSFIRDYSDVEENLHYVVITVEEADSKVHSLLFSFPTTDVGLVDRYRHGENLQAEEVTQESSH